MLIKLLVKFWSDGKEFNINIGDTSLSNVSFIRFLGIIVDEDLSWNNHVEYVKTKLMINKYMLSMSKNFWTKTVCAIYIMLIFMII